MSLRHLDRSSKTLASGLVRAAAALSPAAAVLPAHAASVELLNVSYDPTRELYQQINARFIADWKAKTGEDLSIKQSQGGSSKHARAVIAVREADVVTLGIASDIDALHDHGDLLPDNWQTRLPGDSTPYNSTI